MPAKPHLTFSSFWNDPFVRRLPPHGKLLYQYLFSCEQSHYSGLYILEWVLVTLLTGLTDAEARAAFKLLIDGGKVFWDEERSVVFVRRMLRHQFPFGNPDHVYTHFAHHVQSMHGSPLIQLFLDEAAAELPKAYASVVERLNNEFINRLTTLHQGLKNPSSTSTSPSPVSTHIGDATNIGDASNVGDARPVDAGARADINGAAPSSTPPPGQPPLDPAPGAAERAARCAAYAPDPHFDLSKALYRLRHDPRQELRIVAAYIEARGIDRTLIPSQHGLDAAVADELQDARDLITRGLPLDVIEATIERMGEDEFWRARSWSLKTVGKEALRKSGTAGGNGKRKASTENYVEWDGYSDALGPYLSLRGVDGKWKERLICTYLVDQDAEGWIKDRAHFDRVVAREMKEIEKLTEKDEREVDDMLDLLSRTSHRDPNAHPVEKPWGVKEAVEMAMKRRAEKAKQEAAAKKATLREGAKA